MVLPPIDTMCFTKDFKKGTKICVTGAGGFIASHLAKRLKEEGMYVRGVDWKENEYMPESMFCNEFMNLDLRFPEACEKACEGMEWCFNLAADMGGMGFIQSNHSRILYNSTMISFNVLEAARKAGVKRFCTRAAPPFLLSRKPTANGRCTAPQFDWHLWILPAPF